MAYEPVEGIPAGTILPYAEFPEGPPFTCPWCDSSRTFKGANGLRGHAMAKHGIKWEPSGKMSETRRDWLAKKGLLKFDGLKPGENNLKGWMHMAVYLREVNDYNHAEIAHKLGKRPDVIEKFFKSPASVDCVEFVRHKLNEDPVGLARMAMQAKSYDATMDFLFALEWAKNAQDYDAVHRMTRDLLKATAVMQPDPEDATKQTIVINIGEGRTLDIPTVEVDYEIVEADVEA